MSDIKFNPEERFMVVEPVIDEVYWLQFYNDAHITKPTDYLWVTRWGQDGNNKFSICTYHNEEYKDVWYSDKIAIFTTSISGGRYKLYLPTEQELSWYKAMEPLGTTKDIPNINKWYETTINSDILIFN
jgi:hypothetical protein